MNRPDKIWLEEDYPNNGVLPGGVNIGGRTSNNDIEYIRKEALLEWLESKVYEHNEDRFDDGFNTALGQMIDKINSL